MEHSFNIEHAKKYGLEEAILIGNMRHWITKNKANRKHIYDGRVWTYNSHKAFVEIYPYWNEHKIRRILDSLVDQEILVKGNYNKMSYDRTTWYAFKDESMFLQNSQIELADLPNGSDEIARPIPVINTDINTISNNTNKLYSHKESFVNRVDEFKDKLGNQYESFISYWTEANDKGKMRFQDQKFFDISRRIATWVKNSKNFQPINQETPKIKLK
jgi:hypothetical protein